MTDTFADPAEVARRAAAEAGVEVRELTRLSELAAVYALVDRIWQPDPTDPPVTTELLRAMTHAGNYAAGAYEAARGYEPAKLVGACVGFLAAPAGAALHSHVTGVLADARRRSVGFALKLHQRAWALQRGLTEVTWTFDPLIRRNAYVNLAKLAAYPREYLVDFYGDIDDAINAGQGSDRLLVAWELTSPAVADACAGRRQEIDTGARSVSPALSVATSGAPQPVPRSGWHSAGTVTVDIPPDIEQLRQRDPDTAWQWRLAVRDVLGGLVADGARVIGFSRAEGYVVDRTRP